MDLLDTRREAQTIFYSLPDGPWSRSWRCCRTSTARPNQTPGPASRSATTDGHSRVLLALLGALAIGLSLGLLGSGARSSRCRCSTTSSVNRKSSPSVARCCRRPDRGGRVRAYALHRQVTGATSRGSDCLHGRRVARATLALWVPGPAQLALFAAVMLVAAWRMLRGAAIPDADRAPQPFAVIAGGAGVGALSGLVGVGAGS